jgi:molybdate transport system substrate-binding protein
MKKMYKRAMTVILAVIMVMSMSTVAALAASAPEIQIDGKAVTIAASYGTPFIDSANRTQVPIRAIAEALGATVTWDPATSSGVINGTIKIKLGAESITTPYGSILMDTTAVSKDGRIYVPARFLCDALGYDISATSSNGAVTVNIVTKIELMISAAASMTEALKELQTLYNAAKPNTKLTFNFASSGTLQTQIEQGAPSDVFISAATKNMDTLKTKGLLIDSTIKNILGNDVVLVVPKDSTLKLSSFADVTSGDVKTIAIGNVDSVPAGSYAKDVFTYYQIWDQVEKKAVFGSDVKQVLSWVETGNADCGVVYSTDAASSGKVKIIATAIDASHKPIIYPAAVVRATTHSAAAADFVNFLSTDAAKALFVKYGFKTL